MLKNNLKNNLKIFDNTAFFFGTYFVTSKTKSENFKNKIGKYLTTIKVSQKVKICKNIKIIPFFLLSAKKYLKIAKYAKSSNNNLFYFSISKHLKLIIFTLNQNTNTYICQYKSLKASSFPKNHI